MRLYFDAWASTDLAGTSLGELSRASGKRIRVHYNGAGEGAFQINRHDSQAAWCAGGNFVRARLVSGGPFAYNDSRYVFGFFIGQGDDTTVSPDEEGGEFDTRGGPGALSYVARAIIDPTGANARYKDGVWRWTDGTMGQIVSELIDDAQARSTLPRVTYDFDATNDSNGNPWDVFDGDYDLAVGLQLDEAIGRLQSAGFIARMTPAFLLQAYTAVGTDRSGTITFAKGTNITTDAQREVFASPAKSHMLVQGRTAAGVLTFVWASDSGVQTALGERIEGFTSYQSTASSTVLGRVGTQAINRLKKRRDGLAQIGVLETTFVPFTDYFPGDTVNVNIPGEFDNLHAPITAVAVLDMDNGDAAVACEFEDVAFEPLQLNDKTDPTQSPGTSGGTGGGGASGSPCGGCPPFSGGDVALPDILMAYAIDSTNHSGDPLWGAQDTGWQLVKNSPAGTPAGEQTPVATGVKPGERISFGGSEIYTINREWGYAPIPSGAVSARIVFNPNVELNGLGKPGHGLYHIAPTGSPFAPTFDTSGTPFGSGDPIDVTGTGFFGRLWFTARADVINTGLGTPHGVAMGGYGTPNVPDTGAGWDGGNDVVQTGFDTWQVFFYASVIVTPAPASGQAVLNESVGPADGTATTFSTAFAFSSVSRATVNGVDWTNDIASVDGALGTVTFTHAPKADADVLISYLAA